MRGDVGNSENCLEINSYEVLAYDLGKIADLLLTQFKRDVGLNPESDKYSLIKMGEWVNQRFQFSNYYGDDGVSKLISQVEMIKNGKMPNHDEIDCKTPTILLGYMISQLYSSLNFNGEVLLQFGFNNEAHPRLYVKCKNNDADAYEYLMINFDNNDRKGVGKFSLPKIRSMIEPSASNNEEIGLNSTDDSIVVKPRNRLALIDSHLDKIRYRSYVHFDSFDKREYETKLLSPRLNRNGVGSINDPKMLMKLDENFLRLNSMSG